MLACMVLWRAHDRSPPSASIDWRPRLQRHTKRTTHLGVGYTLRGMIPDERRCDRRLASFVQEIAAASQAMSMAVSFAGMRRGRGIHTLSVGMSPRSSAFARALDFAGLPGRRRVCDRGRLESRRRRSRSLMVTAAPRMIRVGRHAEARSLPQARRSPKQHQRLRGDP